MKNFIPLLALSAFTCLSAAAPMTVPDFLAEYEKGERQYLAQVDPIVELSATAGHNGLEIFSAVYAAVRKYDSRINETVTDYTTSFDPNAKEVGLNNTVGLMGAMADMLETTTQVAYEKLEEAIDYEDHGLSEVMKDMSTELSTELAGTLHGALQAMHNKAVQTVAKNVIEGYFDFIAPIASEIRGLEDSLWSYFANELEDLGLDDYFEHMLFMQYEQPGLHEA